MSTPFVLALDQGTGSSKALLLDIRGQVMCKGQCTLSCQSQRPGWVEQDPEQIWQSVITAVSGVIAQCPLADINGKIAAIGISTQRESCMAWERNGGTPLSPLLSWQDQRTAKMVNDYSGSERHQIQELTGLPLDPMFSALKMRWILDRIDPDRQHAKKGGICLGTVDAWLLYRLGGGHCVEAGNAARTQLVAVERNCYDDELLSQFAIPHAALPEIVPSSRLFAHTRQFAGLPDGIPVTAVLADSHAALFAHTMFVPDAVKATQGTGASIMGLYPPEQATQLQQEGLCRTIAWQIAQPQPAFEGNIRAIGSTLTWLAELFAMPAAQLIELAHEVQDSNGVVFVPAFGGLGCPWWDQGARCLLGGMQLATTRAQIARAALDSIAHQIADVVDCVRNSGIAIERLCVDGGLSEHHPLLQIEANLADVSVVCPKVQELSALGAGYLAGISQGLWDAEHLRAEHRQEDAFHPIPEQHAATTKARAQWQDMLTRARSCIGDHAPQQRTKP